MKKILLASAAAVFTLTTATPVASATSTNQVPTVNNDATPQGIVWGEVVRVFNSRNECENEARRLNDLDPDLWYYCEQALNGSWPLHRRQGFFGA